MITKRDFISHCSCFCEKYIYKDLVEDPSVCADMRINIYRKLHPNDANPQHITISEVKTSGNFFV